MADENEQTLVEKAVRVAIPVGVDALAAATGMPAPVRLVAAPLVNAGVIAYDAPEGEKLTRALVEGGSSFAGGLLGRAAHLGLLPHLEPAAIAELNRPEARSTMAGRAALFAYSPKGQTLMDIAGSALGRAAGRAVADRVLDSEARDAGRSKAAAELGLEKEAFVRFLAPIFSGIGRGLTGALGRGAATAAVGGAERAAAGAAGRGLFSRLGGLFGRGTAIEAAGAESALGRGAANAARTPNWAATAARAEPQVIGSGGVYSPPPGYVPKHIGGPSPFTTRPALPAYGGTTPPGPASTALALPENHGLAQGAINVTPRAAGSQAARNTMGLGSRSGGSAANNVIDAEFREIPKSRLGELWKANKWNVAFGAVPGVLEFTQTGDPRALASAAVGGAAGLRFGMPGSFLGPMVADRVIGRREPEAPQPPSYATTGGVY